MKTKTRIAILFFLSSVFTVILFSGIVYYFVTRYSFIDFYKRLEIRAVFIAKAQEEGGSAFKEARDEHLEILPDERQYIFEIKPGADYSGESQQLGIPVSFFRQIATTGKASTQKGNIFFAGIRYANPAGSHMVIVSAENYYSAHHLAYLRSTFIAAILISSLLTLYMSFLFSRRIFNPVREINDKVKDISSQNLHLRLEISPVSDEMNELKITFNNMLDRLETAFETQNNFISNASHELSTPLTAIIGETDVTLSKIRQPAEYIESLNVVQHEAERLEKITRSLLFLAQTGFKTQQKFQRVRMDQLLWDVKETIERVNPRNKVVINLSLIPENSMKLKIYGDEQLLHLALNNIISNGCKYSNNQPVTVSIGNSDQKVIVVIKDSGIGIPEDEIKYIYDPFFRASNTKNFEGYGIGLPLTRNIIRIHKGTIHVSSKVNTGTTVQLTFPDINAA